MIFLKNSAALQRWRRSTLVHFDPNLTLLLVLRLNTPAAATWESAVAGGRLRPKRGSAQICRRVEQSNHSDRANRLSAGSKFRGRSAVFGTSELGGAGPLYDWPFIIGGGLPHCMGADFQGYRKGGA